MREFDAAEEAQVRELITTPEMARALRRAKRDIQTVTGSWNATTSPVLITKTADAHTGEACSSVTSTSGSATSTSVVMFAISEKLQPGLPEPTGWT